MNRQSLFESSPEDLGEWLRQRGEPAYRAGQIQHALYKSRCDSFEKMTTLPKKLRQSLAEDWDLFTSTVLRESVDDDQTRKMLFGFQRGGSVETVLIPQEEKWTICISTQVGCGMGCVFCASGLNGVDRNLSRGEILQQLVRMQHCLPGEERISRVVVMGMGEPLANLDELLAALAVVTDAKGMGISGRHITISTVGLPTKILRLAETQRPYHLAVSLHAPNDELRRRIVPTAEKTSLDEILSAADEYRRITHRQVTFEYVMLAGINDSLSHAQQLARLLGGRDAFINLIPYNPVEGLDFRTPSIHRTNEFASILREAGFAVKIRKRKGSKIDAACGQLRRSSDPSVPAIVPLEATIG